MTSDLRSDSVWYPWLGDHLERFDFLGLPAAEGGQSAAYQKLRAELIAARIQRADLVAATPELMATRHLPASHFRLLVDKAGRARDRRERAEAEDRAAAERLRRVREAETQRRSALAWDQLPEHVRAAWIERVWDEQPFLRGALPDTQKVWPLVVATQQFVEGYPPPAECDLFAAATATATATATAPKKEPAGGHPDKDPPADREQPSVTDLQTRQEHTR